MFILRYPINKISLRVSLGSFYPFERTLSRNAAEIKARKSKYLVRVGFGYLHANTYGIYENLSMPLHLCIPHWQAFIS